MQIEVEIAAGGGMTRLSASRFSWRLAPADCERFARLTAIVSNAEMPCHHYLDDSEGRGLAIKVSKDEYPDNFAR